MDGILINTLDFTLLAINSRTITPASGFAFRCVHLAGSWTMLSKTSRITHQKARSKDVAVTMESKGDKTDQKNKIDVRMNLTLGDSMDLENLKSQSVGQNGFAPDR